jgi:hypothetical protein
VRLKSGRVGVGAWLGRVLGHFCDFSVLHQKIFSARKIVKNVFSVYRAALLKDLFCRNRVCTTGAAVTAMRAR